MDESALQHRLDRIERRQAIVMELLVGVYLVAGLGFVVHEVAAVTLWHAVVGGVVLAVVAAAAGVYRRRAARA